MEMNSEEKAKQLCAAVDLFFDNKEREYQQKLQEVISSAKSTTDRFQFKAVASALLALSPLFNGICSYSATKLSKARKHLNKAENYLKEISINKNKSFFKPFNIREESEEYRVSYPLIQILSATTYFFHPTHTDSIALLKLANAFLYISQEETSAEEEYDYSSETERLISSIKLYTRGLFTLYASFLPKRVLVFLKIISGDMKFYRENAISSLRMCFFQGAALAKPAAAMLLFYMVNVKGFINKKQTQDDVGFCDEIFESVFAPNKDSLFFNLLYCDFLASTNRIDQAITVSKRLSAKFFAANEEEYTFDYSNLEKEIKIIESDEETDNSGLMGMVWRISYKNAIYNLVNLSFSNAGESFERCMSIYRSFCLDNNTTFVAIYAGICYYIASRVVDTSIKKDGFYSNNQYSSANSLLSLPEVITTTLIRSTAPTTSNKASISRHDTGDTEVFGYYTDLSGSDGNINHLDTDISNISTIQERFKAVTEDCDEIYAISKSDELFAIFSELRPRHNNMLDINLEMEIGNIFNIGRTQLWNIIKFNLSAFNLNNFQFGCNLSSERVRWANSIYKKYQKSNIVEEVVNESTSYEEFLDFDKSFLHDSGINNEIEKGTPLQEYNYIQSSHGNLKSFQSGVSLTSMQSNNDSFVTTGSVKKYTSWPLLDIVEVLVLHLSCTKFLSKNRSTRLIYLMFKEYKDREISRILTLDQQLKVCGFTSDILFHQQDYRQGLHWANKGITIFNKKKFIQNCHKSNLLFLRYLRISNLYHMNDTLKASSMLKEVSIQTGSFSKFISSPSKDWLIKNVEMKIGFLSNMIENKLDKKYNAVKIRAGGFDFVQLEITQQDFDTIPSEMLWMYEWNFRCEEYDVACDVTFAPDDGSEIIIVCKIPRKDTKNDTAIFGRFEPTVPGTLTVHWDNKFSSFTAKNIIYNVELVRAYKPSSASVSTNSSME